MGRIYENINRANEVEVKTALRTLVTDGVSSAAYRGAFFSLGHSLGDVIRD